MSINGKKRPLPPGWRWARLEEICEFKYGEGLPERQRHPGGVPVYGSNGIVGYHTSSITAGAALIVGRKGSIGEVHCSPVPCWPIDTTYYIDAAGTKTDCELPWLYFVLKWLRLDILNKATGVPGLNREDAYRQLLPVPPVEEQRRIAARLSEQMEQMDKMHETAQAQVEAANSVPTALLRQVFESEPAGKWPRRKLGEICDTVSKGTTPTTYGHAFVQRGVPFLRAEDMNGGPVDVEAVAFRIGEETHNFLRRSQLKPGDLLMSIAGTLGRIGYVPNDAAPANCNQAVAFARIKPSDADVRFICFALQAPAVVAPLLELRAGGTIKNLNLQQVRGLDVPVPSLGEQQRVVAHLSGQMAHAEKLRQAVEVQLGAVNALPGALLEDIFGGFEPPS